MNSSSSVGILTGILFFMIFILIGLSATFIILKLKEKNKKEEKNREITSEKKQRKQKNREELAKEYTKESVFSFMDFDKIEDNMIIKKEKKNYLMVVECQGINYDLMSGIEKTSIEKGFLQFLNTLRHPIQIYTQTRTVNLSKSINTYKEKLKEIQEKLTKTELAYRQKENSKKYSKEELEKFKLEVIKQKNLYEYGKDIIKNTEQISLNKNILTKQYYIIISYYSEDVDSKYDKEEIKNIAFSELYTKAQAIISTLFVCGVNARILNSTELIELLYVAYNRDDAEINDLNKMLNSVYEELYSTAPDVLDKRMKELDLKIEEEAIRKANDAVLIAAEESEKEKEVKQKEMDFEELINEMAKVIIEENEKTLGESLTKKAKEIIDRKEGGNVDEQNKNAKRKSRKAI